MKMKEGGYVVALVGGGSELVTVYVGDDKKKATAAVESALNAGNDKAVSFRTTRVTEWSQDDLKKSLKETV